MYRFKYSRDFDVDTTAIEWKNEIECYDKRTVPFSSDDQWFNEFDRQ